MLRRQVQANYASAQILLKYLHTRRTAWRAPRVPGMCFSQIVRCIGVARPLPCSAAAQDARLQPCALRLPARAASACCALLPRSGLCGNQRSRAPGSSADPRLAVGGRPAVACRLTSRPAASVGLIICPFVRLTLRHVGVFYVASQREEAPDASARISRQRRRGRCRHKWRLWQIPETVRELSARIGCIGAASARSSQLAQRRRNMGAPGWHLLRFPFRK